MPADTNWYRKGTCAASSQSFQCTKCANQECSPYEYRVGSCEGSVNGYTCEAQPNCPIGQHLTGLGPHNNILPKKGTCTTCANAKCDKPGNERTGSCANDIRAVKGFKFGDKIDGWQCEATGKCLATMDLVFLIEASNDVGEDGFKQLFEFAKKVAGRFDSTTTEVAAIMFSDLPHTMASLSTKGLAGISPTTKYTEGARKPANKYAGGGRDLKRALDFAQSKVLNPRRTASDGVDTVLVLLTSGKAIDRINDVKASLRRLLVVRTRLQCG